MSRLAKFFILIGTPGCGKSFTMRSIMEGTTKDGRPVFPRSIVFPANRHDDTWNGIAELSGELGMGPHPDHPEKRIPVYKFAEPLTFDGARVVHIDGRTTKFNAILDPRTGFRDGAVFIDDARNAIPSKAGLPADVGVWLSSRRHLMLDIYMSFHSVTDVNIDLWAKGATLVIYQTTVGLTSAVKDKVPNWQELQRTMSRVNATNQKLPASKRWYAEKFQLPGE